MLFMVRQGRSVEVVAVRDLDGGLSHYRTSVLDGVRWAVLHVGFDRPENESIETAVQALSEGLYVTDAARWSLPVECSVSPRRSAQATGRNGFSVWLYAAIGMWRTVLVGPLVDPAGDLDEQRERSPMTPPWLIAIAETETEVGKAIRAHEINTDEAYLTARMKLRAPVRQALDAARVTWLCGGVTGLDIWDLANALPSQVLNTPLKGISMPIRAMNVFRKAKLRTVGDVLSLGREGTLALKNLGRKSMVEVNASVLEHIATTPYELGEATHGATRSASRRETSRVVREAAALERDAQGEERLRDLVDNGLRALSVRERAILRSYFGFNGRAKTLEAIGVEYAISRERVRQIKVRVWEKLTASTKLEHLLRPRLTALRTARREPLYLDTLAAEDAWFDGFQDCLYALGRIITEASGSALKAWDLEGRLVVSSIDEDAWRKAISAARQDLQRELGRGLTQEQVSRRIALIAIAAGAPELEGVLAAQLEAEMHFGSQSGETPVLVAVGRSLRTAVATVLHEAAHPLHLSEIAAAMRLRGIGDYDWRRDGNGLRSLLNKAGAVPFGRSIYGLQKHLLFGAEERAVALAELEGTMLSGPSGRQWHCVELADVLADRMPHRSDDISAYVVNTILLSSQVVHPLGRLIWAVLGDEEVVQQRREIADLVEAVLVKAGRPLSNAELREAITSVRGMSDVFLPSPTERVVRLTKGLWGLRDRDVGVDRAGQRSALDALAESLQRRDRGLHVSELFAALAAIEFQPDAELDEGELLGLAALDPRFRVGRGQIVGLRHWESLRRITMPGAVQKLVEMYERPQTTDELLRDLSKLLERPLNRATATQQIGQGGFLYDAETARWSLDAEDTSGEETDGS